MHDFEEKKNFIAYHLFDQVNFDRGDINTKFHFCL